MQQLPPALAGLAAWQQFVVWIAAPGSEPGKLTKLPLNPFTGEVAGATNPSAWTSFEVAATMAAAWDRGYGAGVGFCLTPSDPFWFLDIDKCLTPAGWSPLAQELCAMFPGAAMEISLSGCGLHVLGSGPAPEHGCRNVPLGLEFYTEGRFVALTGTGAQGDVTTRHDPAVAALVARFFPAREALTAGAASDGPCAEWCGPTDDDELIRRAMMSGQRDPNAAFGHKITFAHLWTGDMDAIRRQWPQGQSEADQALANHLAFWTGRDAPRMERLMRRSGLARDKWDVHRTYLAGTIANACAAVAKVLQDAPPPPPPEATPLAPEEQIVRGAREYLTPADQLRYFEGCVFVRRQKTVWHTATGDTIDRMAFEAVFGGFLFVMDPQGRKTSDSAWEAFTKSRCNAPPIADDCCFRPLLAPGDLVAIDGRPFVNSYTPHVPVRQKGDPSRFLDLLGKMLPDPRDRAILVNYMASLVQNPGVKFQWWPVVQGAQGNGKSLLVEALSYCMGERYSHLPNAQAMARDGLKFNSWIQNKLFLGIEEIYVANRREFLEEMKVVITNRRLGVEGKMVNAYTGDNVANGFICTNHKDGVPIDSKERRYAIFYTAQQDVGDFARFGMAGDYFPSLYRWFREEGGAAVVADYLATVEIAEEFDPARTLHRAPETSSTRAALAYSLGGAEQEVREAIEEGRPGFSGGWVSSYFLDRLLDASRLRVPRNKRREMMRALGYDWHPALLEGRVNDVVTPDNSKPKLYVRDGHEALGMTSAGEIARAYSAAQQPPAQSAVVLAFPAPAKGA